MNIITSTPYIGLGRNLNFSIALKMTTNSSTPPTSSETNEVVHQGFKIGDEVQFQRQDTVAKGK